MTAPKEEKGTVTEMPKKEATAKAPAKRGRPAKAKTVAKKSAAKKVTPTQRVAQLEAQLKSVSENFQAFAQQAEEKNGSLIKELLSTRKMVEIKDKTIADLVEENTIIDNALRGARAELEAAAKEA